MTDEQREFRDLANIGDAPRAALTSSLANVRALGDLMEWAGQQRPPVRIDEIVTQDEYTHDVLMPIEAPLWLAFDVT